jgi:hypothetical protein
MLKASTRALKSGSAGDDSAYTKIESQIQSLTDRRDALALQMKALLNAAAFSGQAIDERQAAKLVEQGTLLLIRAHQLAER